MRKIAETSRVVTISYETAKGGIEGGNINFLLTFIADSTTPMTKHL